VCAGPVVGEASPARKSLSLAPNTSLPRRSWLAARSRAIRPVAPRLFLPVARLAERPSAESFPHLPPTAYDLPPATHDLPHSAAAGICSGLPLPVRRAIGPQGQGKPSPYRRFPAAPSPRGGCFVVTSPRLCSFRATGSPQG
jgi:hypothetical protein